MMKSLLFLGAVAPFVRSYPTIDNVHHAFEKRASNTTGAPAYKPTHAPIFQLSSDSQFAFYLEEVMALSNNNGANSGEVLRAATQIVPNDFESVYNAFYYLAEHIHDIAESVNVTKDPVGARDAYFRAATYYRAADFFDKGNWSDPRITTLWNKQLANFNKAISLLKPVAPERFSVKAHGETIGDFESIGIFYKASASNESRPTVIYGNGYDGSQEESYHQAVRQILERGLNVVTYEGPGQPTIRREQNVGFIPDWWNVVTPVVDYLANREDVDMSKLALFGLSFGGTLAPLAASREHRISAVVCIDGLNNLVAALDNEIPRPIVELYESGNKSYFNEVMHAIAKNSSYPSNFRWLIDQGLWAFDTENAYDWWTRFGNITMGPETVKNLPMPVFVAKGQDDTLTRKQPEIAYRLLSTERPNGEALTTYHQFNTSLGAGEHCSLGAESQVAQVTLDWLSDIWGGMAFENLGQ